MATKTTKASKPVEAEASQATGKKPFIDSSTAVDAYTESKNWFRRYFDPLDEFERIARARPSDSIADDLPKIVDGTMASIIQEQPKRVVQQTPSGLVTCKDYPEYAMIGDFILSDHLLPKYNRNGSMLQKSWNMLGKALTYGRATSYTFMTMTNGVVHTDWNIPYAKDVLDEKGKVFGPDNNIRFLRSWYQKRDLQAIINKEQAMKAKDPSYVSGWDLKLLAQFMEAGASSKPADLQTPAEKEKGGDSGGYEVIHAFQVGVNAEFYSFSPQFEQGKSFRTRINNDPRGKMPLDDLYCNIDLSNPMGRGQVELSGGIQNLIDQQMQMFQFLSTMEMGPPLMVWGGVNKKKLKFRPNAIWDMGNNLQTNKVEPYAPSNYALANFNNNMQYLQSKIFQLNSSQDTSIAAPNGNAGQSKTQAGVNAQESRLGVSDNYLRKQFEEWFANQSETSLNIYMSTMKGDVELPLKADKLREFSKSAAAEYIDPQTKKIKIPYTKIKDVAFKFEVDPSSSEVKEDSDNADKLTEVLKVMEGSQNPAIQEKIPQIVKLIIDEIGAEGTDDLFPELEKDENGQPVNPQQQPQQQGMDPQAIQQLVMQTVQQAMEAQKQAPKPLGESVSWKPADLTPAERAQALQQVGIQADPNGVSPSQTELAIKAHDSVSKGQQADQSHALSESQHNLATLQALAQPDQQPGDENGTTNGGGGSSADQGKPSPTSVQDGQPQQPALDAAISPEEEKTVHDLTMRGFDENDIEHGIVMLRQGMTEQQVIQTLGAKHSVAR